MSTKEELLAYRARWRMVNEFEAEEMRAASIEMRWRQLNAILNMAATLGLFPRVHDDEEVEVARRRWLRLKGTVDEHTAGTSQSRGIAEGNSDNPSGI